MKASRVAGIALFYLAWAILFTYPLILHIGGSVPLSAGGDVYLHLWDLWWADKSVAQFDQSPFFTNQLYHPTGVSLYYHSLDLLNGIVSIPLQRGLGLTVAFNLLLLANLALSGIAAYWLCKEVTGNTGASLVGGALFAAAPLMGTSVNLGQLDEVTAWPIPLYLLALWRILDSASKPWQPGGGRRAIVCAGLALAAASLATWYFTAGLALFTVVFVPLYLLGKRERDSVPRNADTPSATADTYSERLLMMGAKLPAAVLIMAVLLAPLLWGMISERVSGAIYMIPSFETTYSNSADLAALFMPARTELAAMNEHGSNVALGWVALALSATGLATSWRQTWPLLVALGTLALVSLGPELKFAGMDTNLTLPYSLLNNVPFVGASRQPLRFLMTGAILLSILSAFGVAYLQQKAQSRGWNRVVVPAVMLLAGLELFGIPRALVTTQVSGAYTFIRNSTVSGGVIELPYELWQAKSGLSATVHERPVVGGYTSRHFPYPFIEGAPGAAQLAVGYPESLTEADIVSPTLDLTGLTSLDYYAVRYVVLHKSELLSGRFGRLISLLDELYPEGPSYEDDETSVYVTPRGAGLSGVTESKLPLVGLGRGWHELEEEPLRRWTGNDPGNGNAQVWVGIRPGSVGRYALRLNAFAYGKPRHLTVVVGGRTLFEKEVGLAPESLEIDMGDLTAGDYVVELNVREQPDNPVNDRRPLSIGYTLVAVERAP